MLLLAATLASGVNAAVLKNVQRRFAADDEKLVFTGVDSRVKVSGDCSPIPPMTAVTICAWLKKVPPQERATIVSYAVPTSFNELKFYMSPTLRVYTYVKGSFRYDSNIVSDGFQENEWHHMCFGWDNSGILKGYLDGNRVKDSVSLSVGKTVTGGGIMYLGQEQDSFGGGFEDEEALIGELTQVNLWSQRLSDAEVADVYSACSGVTNNIAPIPDVYLWNVYYLDIDDNDPDVSVQPLADNELC